MPMKKAHVLMNKPVYSKLSILDLSKIAMYKFWYDYIKPKYDEKTKLCYMDTDSFIFHIKPYIYENIAQDVDTKIWHISYEKRISKWFD